MRFSEGCIDCGTPTMKLRCPECLTETVKAAEAAPRSPKMTAVEMRFRDVLNARVRAGEVSQFWFEALSFRVGLGRSHYRPDFVAVLADGSLEVTEVKGRHIWEDSRVKFKAAAALYPFATWRMLQWDGEWRVVYDFGRQTTEAVR